MYSELESLINTHFPNDLTHFILQFYKTSVFDACYEGDYFAAQCYKPIGWGFRRACYGGHLEIMKYMIFRGIRKKEAFNWALVNASRYGHLDIVKFMIHKGADCIEKAIQNNKEYPKIVKYLQKLNYSVVTQKVSVSSETQ